MLMQPSPALQLRDFAPEDYPGLIAWFPSEASLRQFAGFSTPWPLTIGQLEARAASGVSDAFTAVLGTGASTTVVGHVELVRVAADHVRFARVAIAPALRGRGLVQGVLTEATRRAVTLGATTLSVYVTPGNTPALRAYERTGFTDAGVDAEQPAYIWMTRKLGS